MSCCICQFSVRNPKNIHEETIGKPPILISDLVQQCTRGTNYVLSEAGSTICNKCRGKLARYHKSLQIARKLRQEIIELIRSPFIIKNLKTRISRSEQFDRNAEVFETVDAADLDDGSGAVATLLNSSTIVMDTEAEAQTEADATEHILVGNTSECDEEEYQAVNLDLDIENEITINEEVPEADIDEEEGREWKCTKRIRTC
ncbi:hypothetical protein ACLKA7_008539 [Drosophila subpalustris]